MWYLTSEIDERVLYVIPNKEITIGRSVDAQVCNFAIPEDASISRKHASLSVSDSGLHIFDQGSRYGTFVNDSRIEINVNIKLNKGDIVRFGKINSVWKVHEIKFITCTSTLKGENLQNLKLCLGNLSGILKGEWDDSCQFLTMPAITLTIKVVLALAQGAHIVTTEFWVNCMEAVRNQRTLPDPSRFIPQVVESTLNKDHVNFLPNEERKSLFAGKTFIFFSRRQFEMYKVVLIKCSATPLLLSETKMTKSALGNDGVIVIQNNATNTSQETQAQRNQINDIVNYLKTKGKRVIADPEIGLAILYCSSEKYCNPDFYLPSEVIKQNSGEISKSTKVLAQESQEPTQKLDKPNIIINESLTPISSKRRMDDEDEGNETNANKKFAAAAVNSNTFTNESIKRKHSDDTNGILNPSKKMAVDNEEDNMFNFLNTTTETTNQDNTEDKLLNFTKPSQQSNNKASNDEEDLFNFVKDNTKENDNSSKDSVIFNDNRKNTYIKKEMDPETIQGVKRKAEDDIDVSAMRGSKLKELMLMQANWTADSLNNIKIKKEEPDEMDQKITDLELCMSVITVRKNLIVKKESLEVEDIEQRVNSSQKNFKTFKKVWPLKRQLNVLPKSSMSIIIPDSLSEEITSQSY